MSGIRRKLDGFLRRESLINQHVALDFRLVLFAAAAALLFPTTLHFRIWHAYRRMPLLLGFLLVASFIWLSENIGTATKTWLYPSQHLAWSMVSPAKLGSWFLLVIVSYTLVSLINAPRAFAADAVDAEAGSTARRAA